MSLTKVFRVAKLWVPTSGAAFASVGTLSLLYFTDWKVVLKYLPYYNGKFKTEENE